MQMGRARFLSHTGFGLKDWAGQRATRRFIPGSWVVFEQVARFRGLMVFGKEGGADSPGRRPRGGCKVNEGFRLRELQTNRMLQAQGGYNMCEALSQGSYRLNGGFKSGGAADWSEASDPRGLQNVRGFELRRLSIDRRMQEDEVVDWVRSSLQGCCGGSKATDRESYPDLHRTWEPRKLSGSVLID